MPHRIYEELENNSNNIGFDFNTQKQQMKMEINWSFWNFGEEDYSFLAYCLTTTFNDTINLDQI